MKIVQLFLVFVFGLSVVACTEVPTEDASVEKYSRTSNQMLVSGYSHLGEIPLSAWKNMDDKEKEVWGKVGKKVYVNYSFIDSTFYVRNKENILRRYASLYDKVLINRKDTCYLVISNLRAKSMLTAGVTRSVNRFEQGKGGWYFSDPQVMWSNGKVSLMAVGYALFSKDRAEQFLHKVYATPKEAEFRGVDEHRAIGDSGLMEIYASGSLVIGSESFSVRTTILVDMTRCE